MQSQKRFPSFLIAYQDEILQAGSDGRKHIRVVDIYLKIINGQLSGSDTVMFHIPPNVKDMGHQLTILNT